MLCLTHINSFNVISRRVQHKRRIVAGSIWSQARFSVIFSSGVNTGFVESVYRCSICKYPSNHQCPSFIILNPKLLDKNTPQGCFTSVSHKLREEKTDPLQQKHDD